MSDSGTPSVPPHVRIQVLCEFADEMAGGIYLETEGSQHREEFNRARLDAARLARATAARFAPEAESAQQPTVEPSPERWRRVAWVLGASEAGFDVEDMDADQLDWAESAYGRNALELIAIDEVLRATDPRAGR